MFIANRKETFKDTLKCAQKWGGFWIMYKIAPGKYTRGTDKGGLPASCSVSLPFKTDSVTAKPVLAISFDLKLPTPGRYDPFTNYGLLSIMADVNEAFSVARLRFYRAGKVAWVRLHNWE